ncbi:family 43 glycosylhydrolase [Pseudozobellia sp. WGM2]|uniref:family 43 glycosylhydrolase n=1 Tax=Pseudozobellia sp. WGM2 TaxID=2787625 RepID=UPI001AE00E51|nr:family 43 glycosylhydrolase [Pseudozobellia sp. WGM2]
MSTKCFFLFFGVLAILTSCAENQSSQDHTAYLFTYFTGNGEGEEAIRYALSRDGFNYYALNNDQPIIASGEISETGGVRDPHILRGNDGYFYMTVTDLLTKNGWSNTKIVLMRSKDLISWKSHVINIPERFASFSEITRAWAPQTFYDEKADKLMVYFSMLEPGSYDKIYYSYANEDFSDLATEPKQLFFSPDEKACIDGDIILKDGTYHLFYKTEGTDDKGIKVATSKNLTEGYESLAGNVDQTDKAVEGSGVFKLLDDDTYILLYDMYMDGRYQFAKSTDLTNFEALGADVVSMDFHPRHGTVITISEAEAARLVKAFPSRDLPLVLGAEATEIKTHNIYSNREKQELYIPVQPGTNIEALKPKLVLFPGVKQAESKNNVSSSVSLELPNEEMAEYSIKISEDHNPVLEGYYADPEIVFSHTDNKFYLYPTSDGFDSWSGTYFKTFSSSDLVNWNDEGVILDLNNDVSWADRNAWAPCIAEKKTENGYKYYYYYTAAQNIGVAVADNPAGPFKDLGHAFVDYKTKEAKGGQVIDPDVFTDPVSGKSYFYYGNGFMAAAELNDDMVSLKKETLTDLTPEDGTFREGTEVFYRNGTYYFMWSEDDTRSPNYRVRYATSNSPMGPLSIPKENLVIEKDSKKEIYGTGHNSVINVPGTDDWYIVYHRFTRPKGITMGSPAGFHREVCIDELEFNADGSMKKIKPTLEGVDPVSLGNL